MKLKRFNNAAIIWRSENELNKMKKNIIHWLDIECVNCFLVLFVLRGRRRGVESSRKIVSDENWKLNNTANKHFWIGFRIFISFQVIFLISSSFLFFLFCFVMLLSSENYFRVFFCFPLRFFNLLFSLPSYPINCYCDINYEWLL